MNDREISGLWWIPAKPENKWVGKLCLKPEDSPELHITIPEGHFLKIPDIPELLHGCDEQGKPITLLHTNCHHRRVFGAITQFTCSAGFAITGVHISTRDEFRANSLILDVENLFEWLGLTGFQREPSDEKGFRINYEFIEPLKYEVNEKLKVEIRADSTSASEHQVQKISENVSIKFVSIDPLNLSECLVLRDSIRHLLHFAVLKTIYPTSLHFEIEGHGMSIEDLFIPHKLEIVSAENRHQASNDIHPERWVFKFSDVQSDFGALLQRWNDFLKKFNEAMDCYFSTIYHTLPHTIELLCLTQCLEAYQGIKNQTLNEQKFLQKIEALLQAHQLTFPKVFVDTSELAKAIRDNRNYYTHHNPKWLQEGRVVSGAELYWLNIKLKMLFQACVLEELGISKANFHKLTQQLRGRIIEYK